MWLLRRRRLSVPSPPAPMPPRNQARGPVWRTDRGDAEQASFPTRAALRLVPAPPAPVIAGGFVRAPSPSDILLSALDRRLSLVPCCEGGLGRGQFLFDGIKIRRCLCCNCQRTERFPKLCLSHGYPLVCCLHALFLLGHGIVRKVRCRRRRGGHD